MYKIAVIVFCMVLGLCSSAYAVNYSLLFDGDNDYVAIPDNDYNDFSTAMTIEAWVKPIDNHHYELSPQGPETIVSKWCADPQWEMAYQLKTRYNNNDKIAFIATDRPDYRVAPAVYMVDLTGNQNAPDYQWTHVAAVFNGTNAYLYRNGILDSTAISIPEGDGTINRSPRDLWIGAANVAFGSGSDVVTENFPGYIDEVRLWNVARTQQEIQDWMYYSLYGNEAGLTGYYNFDDGSGQVLTDLVNGVNGRLGQTAGIDDYDPQWVISDSPISQAVVPEPASMLLFGLGGLAMAVLKKKNM